MGFFVGVDLGQSKDFSALAIVERVPAPPVEVITPWSGRVTTEPAPAPPALHVRHLQRFPLGTRYPTIVDAGGALLQRLVTPWARPMLIVDKTGVGAAVVDLFVAAGLEPVAITITSGNEAAPVPGGWNVPKRDLVSAVQATLQTGRLKFAEALPDVATLTKELLDFQYKLTAAAHDTYGAWRAGTHDDLVLAVAMAVWYVERVYHPPWTKPDLHALSGGLPV